MSDTVRLLLCSITVSVLGSEIMIINLQQENSLCTFGLQKQAKLLNTNTMIFCCLIQMFT